MVIVQEFFIAASQARNLGCSVSDYHDAIFFLAVDVRHFTLLFNLTGLDSERSTIEQAVCPSEARFESGISTTTQVFFSSGQRGSVCYGPCQGSVTSLRGPGERLASGEVICIVLSIELKN